MTQDEIIEMARQAKAIPIHKDFNQLALIGIENIEAFAKLVAQNERTWVGLTPEEFHEACWESYVDPVTGECSTGDREYAVRWTEAKLKKNNT